MIKERIKKLAAVLREQGLDALFVSSESNVRYLSGYTNHEAYLLITAAEDKLLLTDFRYEEIAQGDCPDFHICLTANGRPLEKLLQQLCSEHGLHKVGFEQDFVSYAMYERLRSGVVGAQLLPCSGVVEKLRLVKDESEIDLLHKACAATDRVFSALCDFIKAGQTEREIEWQLLTLTNKEGCGVSFDPIVVSGVRGSLPHGVATDKVVEEGDFITMDFGCLYQGYHADMTRTVHLGKPDARQLEIYNIVLEAQSVGFSAIRPGILGRDADAAARMVIAGYGYGQYFGHGLGHGVGLDIHEGPSLNSSGNIVLQPGHFVTVEPGIYIPGWGGIRIEDTVLVTADGAESMFSSAKELLCL